MYAIQAQRIITAPDGNRSVQLPTFYLDENVQGITSGTQAQAIALQILHAGFDHIKDSATRVSYSVSVFPV